MIRTHINLDGEIQEIEIQGEELEATNAFLAEAKATAERLEAEQAVRQSALDKLAVLGLSEDEAKAILGL